MFLFTLLPSYAGTMQTSYFIYRTIKYNTTHSVFGIKFSSLEQEKECHIKTLFKS